MEDGEKVYTGTVEELFFNAEFMREIRKQLMTAPRIDPQLTPIDTLRAALWALDGMEESLHSQRALILASVERMGGKL